MFRCMKPGCPDACGTRRQPSCVDRLLQRGLLAILAAAFLLSLAAGLLSLNRAEGFSRRAPEAMPVAPAEALELVRETGDHGQVGIRRNRHGKPAILADALVQIGQPR